MLSNLNAMAKWVGEDDENRHLNVRAYSESSWVCTVSESGYDVVRSRSAAGAGCSIEDAVHKCYLQFLSMIRKERSRHAF